MRWLGKFFPATSQPVDPWSNAAMLGGSTRGAARFRSASRSLTIWQSIFFGFGRHAIVYRQVTERRVTGSRSRTIFSKVRSNLFEIPANQRHVRFGGRGKTNQIN
jgi:hypothetical protein